MLILGKHNHTNCLGKYTVEAVDRVPKKKMNGFVIICLATLGNYLHV